MSDDGNREIMWLVLNTILILGLIGYKVYADRKWTLRFERLELEARSAIEISKGHARITEAQQREVKEVVETVKNVVGGHSDSGGKIPTLPPIS